MYNPLSRLIDWYLAPVQDAAGTAGTGLGVLPSREGATDIVAHLLATDHTPASVDDVRDAFRFLTDRDATPFEELLALDHVNSFGLLAR